MGRARIAVSDAVIAVFLRDGFRAAVPVAPLRNVVVLDAEFVRATGTVRLLIESPDVEGRANATLQDAPPLDVVFRTPPVLETAAGDFVTLALSRIADRRCECPTSITASDPPVAASCPACLARHAIAHLPTPWLETASATRGTLGELVAEPDPGEHTDEVPGS